MKKKNSTLKTIIAALAILALAAAAVFSGARYFSSIEASSERSRKVSLSNSLLVEPGMSRSEVERIFGAKGTRRDDGATLYCSEAVMGTSQPRIQVLVLYDEHIVRSVTFLDLENATVTGSVGVMGSTLKPDSLTVGSIEKAVGHPVSMYRIYSNENGDDILEVHFGFTDPFANFDPAWRGEYAVTCKLPDGPVSCRNWVGYDGSDPLMVDSVEGLPISNQYDSYTDFLNDKFAFDYGMLMLNHYSLGDTQTLYGKITPYGSHNGTQLYSADSDETLEDGTPLYRMSFGFDADNYFKIFSFVNMRLFGMIGTLKDSGVSAVTKGMSYGEVRNLMMVVPSALYIDENFFIVCYGRYLDTPSMEEQFELVIRFDTRTSYAQDVYDNTARSDMLLAGETPPSSEGENGGTEPEDQPT